MAAKQWKIFAALVSVFLVAYFMPLGNPKVEAAIFEAFKLLQWYARNHALACVVPALFIAGGIITFLTPASVMRYLGPKTNKLVAYSVASVAGVILAVCSCSVLPMFPASTTWVPDCGRRQRAARHVDLARSSLGGYGGVRVWDRRGYRRHRRGQRTPASPRGSASEREQSTYLLDHRARPAGGGLGGDASRWHRDRSEPSQKNR